MKLERSHFHECYVVSGPRGHHAGLVVLGCAVAYGLEWGKEHMKAGGQAREEEDLRAADLGAAGLSPSLMGQWGYLN